MSDEYKNKVLSTIPLLKEIYTEMAQEDPRAHTVAEAVRREVVDALRISAGDDVSDETIGYVLATVAGKISAYAADPEIGPYLPLDLLGVGLGMATHDLLEFTVHGGDILE